MDLHASLEFTIVESVALLVKCNGLSRADVQELAGPEITRRVAEDDALLDATRSHDVRRAAELATALAFEIALWLQPTND